MGGIDVGTLRVLAEAPPGFAVLGGDDPILFPLVLLGAAGAVAASAHVCTRRFVEMIECALAGKVDDGRAHHEALLPVVQACFAEPNPAVFKGVLAAQGLIATPDVRAPLANASARRRRGGARGDHRRRRLTRRAGARPPAVTDVLGVPGPRRVGKVVRNRNAGVPQSGVRPGEPPGGVDDHADRAGASAEPRSGAG